MLGLSATGVLVGGLWAWIAPPIHAVVAITRAGERVHEYLGSESQNFFIAPFMLLGLLSVLAVVASALMWQWREHRGPQMVVWAVDWADDRCGDRGGSWRAGGSVALRCVGL